LSFPDTTHLNEQRTLYIKNGIIEHIIMDSEDARLFRMHNRTFAIFTRLKSITPYRTNMVVADLSLATPREVILQYAEAGPIEKNWVVNNTYHDDLYLSYSLNPHVVLKLDVDTGKCTKAFETFNENITAKLRGSSQMVKFNKHYLIAVVHTTITQVTWPFRCYDHAFCAFEAVPPFRCVSLGPWFRFPDVYKDSRDSIQFCCGIAEHDNGYLLSYGIADCIAKFLYVSKTQVERYLPILKGVTH
jgi:hypothetical protein